MYRFGLSRTEGLKFCLLPVLFVLLVSALVGCSKSEPHKTPVLRIGHAPHDHHAPLYVAAMNPDYFREHGGVFLKEVRFRKEYILIRGNKELAHVVIDSTTGGKKLIRTLVEGHNDISFGGVPAMLGFIDQGSEIEILLPIQAEGSGLVVEPDIPAANWEEFVSYLKKRNGPLKIGYKTAVSVQNLIFETALDTISIPYTKDVENPDPSARIILVNLFGAKNLLPALENGLIDGFVVNQPFVAMTEFKGSGRMVASLSDLPPAGQWRNNPCCALAANKEFVAAHPDIVDAFVELMLQAGRFIREDPEKSAGQIAAWLGIDPEIEKLSLPTIRYATGFDEDWNRGVEFWVGSMVRAGRLKRNVKTAYEQGQLYEKIYNMQPFRQAVKNI